MARGEILANAGLDPPFQVLVQGHALTQHHEQRHERLPPQVFQVDHQAVEHLRQFLHHAVDLAGAHANAVAVDGGVGTAVDHRPAAWRDADPVAVAPDAGEHVEVAVVVAVAALVVPEIQRHGGHRFGDHQLAHFVVENAAVVVHGVNRRAQIAALHFTGVHRLDRTGAHVGGGHIGAAADGGDQHVTQLIHDPAVALLRQR